jgi:hypothetical protein
MKKILVVHYHACRIELEEQVPLGGLSMGLLYLAL